MHLLSRAASDVHNNDQHATHTRRERDHDRGMSELGVNIERSVDRLLRLMANAEFSDTESSSSSSSSDGSVMSGRSGSRKGKSRENERVVEDTSSSRTHRATAGDFATNSMGAAAPAARASTSSAVQGTSIPQPLVRVASPLILPPDDEESRARARSHRRRSSGDPSRPRGTHTHVRRRLVVHKRQEVGICKSLSLIFL